MATPSTTMSSTAMPDPCAPLLLFDVFGTVVDWHGSIVREMAELSPAVDGDAFARAWRAGYQPAMAAVRDGRRPWVVLDTLHREILEQLLPPFGLSHLDEGQRRQLNQVWHRLRPWPDSVAGLTRLKQAYTIAPLSNGNIALLTNMAKRAGLPWDCVLSAEIFHAYKPDPAVYRGAAALFDRAPGQVMLVAAHHDDLAAARACGLRTAYIERPLEFGAAHVKDVSPQPGTDWHARSLLDLADQLGC